MRAVLMRYGHDPAAIDGYTLRDCRAFMRALPVVQNLGLATLGEVHG